MLIHIYLTRYGFGITSDFSFNLSSWLVFLGIFNSVVNPFIYAYQRKDFRSGCQKLCCGCGRRAASAKYCGIIRIRGGSIFVEFVGTPHPRIYILNELISKIFIEHFNEKGMVCNITYII